jgi:hypothetical protein
MRITCVPEILTPCTNVAFAEYNIILPCTSSVSDPTTDTWNNIHVPTYDLYIENCPYHIAYEAFLSRKCK